MSYLIFMFLKTIRLKSLPVCQDVLLKRVCIHHTRLMFIAKCSKLFVGTRVKYEKNIVYKCIPNY